MAYGYFKHKKRRTMDGLWTELKFKLKNTRITQTQKPRKWFSNLPCRTLINSSML